MTCWRGGFLQEEVFPVVIFRLLLIYAALFLTAFASNHFGSGNMWMFIMPATILLAIATFGLSRLVLGGRTPRIVAPIDCLISAHRGVAPLDRSTTQSYSAIEVN